MHHVIIDDEYENDDEYEYDPTMSYSSSRSGSDGIIYRGKPYEERKHKHVIMDDKNPFNLDGCSDYTEDEDMDDILSNVKF